VASPWDFIMNLNATANQGKPWGAGAAAYSGAGGGTSGGELAPSGFLRTMGRSQPSPSGDLLPTGFDPYGLSRTGFDPTGFQAPASPGQPASESPGWLQSLLGMAKTPSGDQAAPTMRPTPKAPGAAAPLPSQHPQSEQGLFGNSRKGFDLQSLMQLASLVGTFGAAGAAGGAMGGGMGMGGGGAVGGAGGMMGGAGGGGFLSGLMGGGGGGQQKGAPPRGSFAPLPEQYGPLVPQNNPWAYVG
jgi:hypothetical protein